MRRVVITGVLLAAALAPGQSIASTHAPQRNWALMLVTAGRHGAADVRLSGDANGVQPGAQPLVVGVLFADQRPHHPRIVVSLMVQNGGGPDQVRSAGPLGHQQFILRPGAAGAVSFGSSGQFGNFAPGETLAELFVFAGGSLTRTHLDAVASSGRLTVKRVYGTGATALYVADDQDAGL
ncbi:MAG: hypothetical protein ACTHK4_04715, partial [Mycobacteriales bacterium]